MYVFFVLCILLLYCTESYVISKLHACTFVACSLNVIDYIATELQDWQRLFAAEIREQDNS